MEHATSTKNIKGIFFEESTIVLGTGHTQKTQTLKNFCLAEQIDDERIKLTFLGNEGNPTGIVVELPYEEFLSRYTLEPNFKVKTLKEQETDLHIARAEKHRNRKEYNSAEWEYTSALKLDPESIRAHFGIGTLYMEMGDRDKARSVFEKISQIDALFEEENKHIFNEFGIALRKAAMLDEARSHYLKALEISPQDEHLCFNIARLYFEKQDWTSAMEWIHKALEINPLFREARHLESMISQRASVSS
ncbi:MAG TPA: tetratricopeptide repeat protein [Deltaproteobacteria bacterium]|nr:tetratricopeptide repeat protein [Deltaproteobacteria bacterium]